MRQSNPASQGCGLGLQLVDEAVHPEFSPRSSASSGTHIEPSIGLSGFSDKLFSEDGMLTPWGSEIKMEQLKRARIRLRAMSGVLFLLLCLMCVMYYTKKVAEEPPLERQFDNNTEKIGLDFSHSHGHGLCMGRPDQSFTVFMNGVVVANGNDCNMRFVSATNPRAPECVHNMKDNDLWLAVEVQDSEEDSALDTSVLAFATRLEWCGVQIATDRHWECNENAYRNWQCPTCSSDVNESESGTGWETASVILPDPSHPEIDFMSKEVTGQRAQWIGLGGVEFGSEQRAKSVNSVYCRRKIGCGDKEFKQQLEADTTERGGLNCSDWVEIAEEFEAEQIKLAGCDNKEEAETSDDPDGEGAKCTPGLLENFPANLIQGGGGMLLILYMFIGFHIVCDDFFVPSLNVLCEKLQMPDDIAGATFMAAGASSPELFSSLIGVLTNSAVGAGTVVGSELFNMLVIIGGVCLVTPIPLALDWRPLVREVLFFGLSLIGILVVLADSVVQWYEALVLMFGYICYVVACASFPKIVAAICPLPQGGQEGEEFQLEDVIDRLDNAGEYSYNDPMRDSMRQSITFSKEQLNGAAFGMDYGDVIMHGFIHKKSEFYTKVRNSKQMWQKRWLVLDEDKLYYQKKNGKDRVLIGTPTQWGQSWVRFTSRTEFTITVPGNELVFKTEEHLANVTRQWVKCIGRRIEHFKTMSPTSSAQAAMMEADQADEEDEEFHDLLTVPESLPGKMRFVLSLPLLVAFKFSIVDVRKKKYTQCYPITMGSAIIWLAILAEGMMRGADASGCILGISEDLMGLTITAVGTSLPNLFASIFVARQGLGNMSVSNAFGSNTFNIFIALALPWLVGAILAGHNDTCGSGYAYPVERGKIFTSCLILAGVLLMVVSVLIMTKMMLTKTIGYFFNVAYIAILGYLIIS